MRKIIMLALVLIFTFSCIAQKQKSSPEYSSAPYLKKSKNQQRGAWVLAGLGACVSIASAVNHSNKVKGRNLAEQYWASQGYTPNPPPEPIPDYTYRYVASAGCIIGSAILFKAASKNKKKAASASAFLKMEKMPVLQGAAFKNSSYPCVGVGVKL